MEAILRFLYIGHPRLKVFKPTLAEYISLLAFVIRYEGPPSLRSLLKWHVNAHADRIITEMGPEPAPFQVVAALCLAHRLRAEDLWATIFEFSRSHYRGGWEILHNPWSMDEGDVEQCETQLWSILLLVARIKGATGLSLHDLKVTYPSGECHSDCAHAREAGHGQLQGGRQPQDLSLSGVEWMRLSEHGT